ncbi:MAG: hypothetical protein AMXMBFR53_11230 [Gemmatimonadota bacterium]
MKASSRVLALLGLAALAACDVPTEAPILEQRWVLPVENTTISVNELLPAGVTASGNSFSVSVSPFSTSRTLGELCGAPCVATQGLTVPSPAFNASFTVSQSLPAKVSAAALQSGAVTIAITNGFNFDPLANGGTLKVTVTDGVGGRPLGEASFAAPMNPGGTKSAALTLSAGAVGATLVASVAVQSPGGQLTTIENSQRLTVNATPGAILVSSATVNVANESVTFDAVDLDVEDIDSEISDRIENGSILLTITNPFGVSLGAQADITYPGGKISKTLNIAGSATSTATLSYDGAEFRTFLGKSGVKFTGSGTVSSSAGNITVTPGQKAVIDAKIDLTLRIGG